MLGQALAADEPRVDEIKDAKLAPRLLVVDDDNLHRMIICRAAAKVGYIPVGGANYQEAAKLLQKSAFDCITLDVVLGQCSGVDLLHHLAAVGCKAPIIVVSGCDDATLREALRVARSLQLKLAEPIRKPVDLTILRYMLEGIRRQPSAAGDSA